MYRAYIGGLPHAFNIIDGCNGFAGTVAVLVCLIGAPSASWCGTIRTATPLPATAGPMVIAVAVVKLVQRHRVVSPRFPILLIYCVL